MSNKKELEKEVKSITESIKRSTKNLDKALSRLEKIYKEFNTEDQLDIIRIVAKFLDYIEELAGEKKMALYHYLKKDESRRYIL